MICFRITMQEKGILEEKKTKQTAFSGDEGLVLFNVYITILIHRHISMDSLHFTTKCFAYLLHSIVQSFKI